jgi:hypothetical protein
VHEVVIACGSEVIARHRRSYEREAVIFDPLHYLALLEQKTRALDQAAPLAGWQLPECFAQLRRLLEARLITSNLAVANNFVEFFCVYFQWLRHRWYRCLACSASSDIRNVLPGNLIRLSARWAISDCRQGGLL